MSPRSAVQESEAVVVAVSVGADARWSWRIVARNGQRLLESTETFADLGQALEDGRRHVPAALGVGLPDEEDPSPGPTPTSSLP
jgi:hypothetical protein